MTTPAQAQPPKQTEMPPRILVTHRVHSGFQVSLTDGSIGGNGKVPHFEGEYLSLREHTALLADAIKLARKSAFEELAKIFHAEADRIRDLELPIDVVGRIPALTQARGAAMLCESKAKAEKEKP